MDNVLYKKVVKNGSSLAINIPAKEVKKQDIKAGDVVEVTIKKAHQVKQDDLREIDGLISDYWDMLDYLKDKQAVIKYLSEKDILSINARIIQREGEKDQKSHIRDAEALHFLIEQPRKVNFGQELYPTFSAKAGILLIKLIKKHVFEDANKRTASIAFLLFLERNSCHLTCSWKELADLVLKIAKTDDNELKYNDIYTWIGKNIEK